MCVGGWVLHCVCVCVCVFVCVGGWVLHCVCVWGGGAALHIMIRTLTLNALYHFWDSFGLPLTVLCQTTGKLVTDAKFCVTAIAVSMFKTTCHHPPGTNTVSPGH